MLSRTPDSFPSFLNDIASSVLEFVANTNRERLRYRANGYRFTLPVVAPNGTRDPFYYIIGKYYGASDHLQHLARSLVATGDDDMAAKVAAGVLALGSERMGEAERKGLGYLSDAGSAAALAAIEDFIAYLDAQVKAGTMKLTEKPEEPKPVVSAKPAKGKKK